MANNKVYSLFMAVLCSFALSSLNFNNVTSGLAPTSGQLEALTGSHIALRQPGIQKSPAERGELGIRRLAVLSSSVYFVNPIKTAEGQLATVDFSEVGGSAGLETGGREEAQDQQPPRAANRGDQQIVNPSVHLNLLPPTAAPDDILAWEIRYELPDERIYDAGTAASDHSYMQPSTEAEPSHRPIPIVQIKYDKYGNYDARNTWKDVDIVHLLARAMLAEENEKLLDAERVVDFIGAGWVMVNRTKAENGYFDYAEGSLYKILTPYQQFALGGYIMKNGEVLPGNSAYVANPEAYAGWFGDDVRAAYWIAYQIAKGILDGTLPDPTNGALYFADAYQDGNGSLIPFSDGRTRFWYRDSPCYTIDELRALDSIPWP